MTSRSGGSSGASYALPYELYGRPYRLPYARPYRPSALGGCGLCPLPTTRLAIRTSASSTPMAAAPTSPMPPPPYAAPAAMRRATLALDMLDIRRRHLLVPVHPLIAPYRPSANPDGR